MVAVNLLQGIIANDQTSGWEMWLPPPWCN